jgi:hypothetical protein
MTRLVIFTGHSSRVVARTEQKNSTYPFLPRMSWKATKQLKALPPEMDCDQKMMGSPTVTSTVFLIAASFWWNMDVLKEHLRCFCYPFTYKAWVVCSYVCTRHKPLSSWSEVNDTNHPIKLDVKRITDVEYIIISLLMFSLLGHSPSLRITHKKNGL